MSEPVRRVTVSFAESTYAALRDLAEQKDKSMGEILRDAIALERWVAAALAEGGRLLIQRGDESRELVFP